MPWLEGCGRRCCVQAAYPESWIDCQLLGETEKTNEFSRDKIHCSWDPVTTSDNMLELFIKSYTNRLDNVLHMIMYSVFLLSVKLYF